MSSKNTYIIFVLLAVLVLGGLFFVRKSVNKNKQTETTPPVESTVSGNVNKEVESTESSGTDMEEGVVEYTNEGFFPKSLTVPFGTTVKFINKSDSEMWVASAPHPEHTNYPEFDQKTGIGNGGEYTFTFSKIGNWKYHNHLMPSRFGEIIVVDQLNK